MYTNNSLHLSWPDKEAVESALKRCGIDHVTEAEDSKEFLSYFADWYFSGDGWKHTTGREDDTVDISDCYDYLYHLEKEEHNASNTHTAG